MLGKVRLSTCSSYSLLLLHFFPIFPHRGFIIVKAEHIVIPRTSPATMPHPFSGCNHPYKCVCSIMPRRCLSSSRPSLPVDAFFSRAHILPFFLPHPSLSLCVCLSRSEVNTSDPERTIRGTHMERVNFPMKTLRTFCPRNVHYTSLSRPTKFRNFPGPREIPFYSPTEIAVELSFLRATGIWLTIAGMPRWLSRSCILGQWKVGTWYHVEFVVQIGNLAQLHIGSCFVWKLDFGVDEYVGRNMGFGMLDAVVCSFRILYGNASMLVSFGCYSWK